MNKNRVFKAKALHYWLNFTERLAEIILHRNPDSYDVTLEKCVPYGQGKYNNLDIIRPKNNTEKLPLMIYVHGGGWISGVKSMRRTYCYEYAKKGVVVANIDYIWAPLKQFPYPVQDVLDAIDFLFDNAERFNIDTSKIIFGGESAGVYFGMILNFIAGHFETLDVMGLKFRHAKEFKITVNMFKLRRVRYARACIVQVSEHGYYGGKSYRYFHKRHKRRALRGPNQRDLSRKVSGRKLRADVHYLRRKRRAYDG